MIKTKSWSDDYNFSTTSMPNKSKPNLMVFPVKVHNAVLVIPIFTVSVEKLVERNRGMCIKSIIAPSILQCARKDTPNILWMIGGPYSPQSHI